MQNKHLKLVKSALSNYFSYFKSPNILVVSEDKSVLPFAYVIVEKAHPDHLLLSLAIDYPFPDRVVDLALIVNNIKTVALADGFFVAQTGNTYLGEEAHHYYQIETEVPIKDIDPSSGTLH